MESFTASVLQVRATADRQANLDAAAELVAKSAAEGADLVALPELFVWSGPQSQETSQAETIPGPTTDFLSDLAKQHEVHLLAGSLLERGDHETDVGEKVYNTSPMFAPDGRLVAAYRKIHLFDVEITGAVTASESRTRAAGTSTVCCDTALGCVGMAICYDLRFPELFRRLAAEGAEIVVIPSAFTAHTGSAHWHALVRARAIENQCFVIAPNQYGPTSHGFDSYGHSLIVDPWGEILAEGTSGGPEVLTAAIDAARLAGVRERLPSLGHRRLDT